MAAVLPAMRDPKWMEEDAFQRNGHLKERDTMVSKLVVGRTGAAKLVSYDASKLLKYGAIWTIGVQGTVFNRPLFKSLLQYVFVFLAGAAALFVVNRGWEGKRIGEGGEILGTIFESEIIGAIEGIHSQIRRPTMFIFGLFTSLTIARWWALRVGSLGVLMDAVVHTTTFLAMAIERKPGLTPEKLAEFEQDAFKIVKLGVASVHCITQLSRDSMSYQSLVDDELLTPDEAGILDGCTDSAQVVWSWIAMLGGNILTRIGMPPPNHNPFVANVQGATLAITRIQAYHDSQLPFPYVHMMVLLVNVNNLLTSVIDGLHFGRIINGMCREGFSDNQCIAAVVLVLHLAMVPTFYQALLQICFLIEDPMGDDITDFPIRAFQVRIYGDCKSLLKASHDFWDQRRKAEAATTASAPTAPAPPPPAPPASAAIAPPPGIQKTIADEVARQFEGEMAKHVADLTSGARRLARRADDFSKRVPGPGAPIPAK